MNEGSTARYSLPTIAQLRENLALNMPAGSQVTDLAPVTCSSEVQRAFLERVKDTVPEEREVVFAFHGSHPTCYDSIVSTGFRCSDVYEGFPNVYLAPSMAQSHLYARKSPLDKQKTMFEQLISILVIRTNTGARTMPAAARTVRQPVRVIGCIGGTFAVNEPELLLPVARVRYTIPPRTRAPLALHWSKFELERDREKLFTSAISRAIPCAL